MGESLDADCGSLARRVSLLPRVSLSGRELLIGALTPAHPSKPQVPVGLKPLAGSPPTWTMFPHCTGFHLGQAWGLRGLLCQEPHSGSEVWRGGPGPGDDLLSGPMGRRPPSRHPALHEDQELAGGAVTPPPLGETSAHVPQPTVPDRTCTFPWNSSGSAPLPRFHIIFFPTLQPLGTVQTPWCHSFYRLQASTKLCPPESCPRPVSGEAVRYAPLTHPPQTLKAMR
jgi:hypothetical protein